MESAALGCPGTHLSLPSPSACHHASSGYASAKSSRSASVASSLKSSHKSASEREPKVWDLSKSWGHWMLSSSPCNASSIIGATSLWSPIRGWVASTKNSEIRGLPAVNGQRLCKSWVASGPNQVPNIARGCPTTQTAILLCASSVVEAAGPEPGSFGHCSRWIIQSCARDI